jgi:hypothetical protein
MTPNVEATLKRFDEISASIEAQKATKQTGSRYLGDDDGRRVNVPRYCADHNIEIVAIKDAPGGGAMYCLKNCIFDRNHGPNEASIIQQPSGQLSYQCFHETCKGFRWHEARQAISGDAILDPWMIGDNGHTGEPATVQVTSATSDVEDSEPYDIFGETLLTGKPAWPDGACPKAIDAFARDEAERIGVDVAMVALPAIGCAAIATRDTFRIQPKANDSTWLEFPLVWIGIVAKPGNKKSPALTAAQRPLFKIAHELHQAHTEDMARYTSDYQRWLDNKKEGDEPQHPVERRIYTDDSTIEALRDLMEKHHEGFGIIKDELSGWITSFDVYRGGKGGKDRADYCELYNPRRKSFDRAGKGHISVPWWGASIIGGIQPGPVARLMGDITDDGLVARFLVAVCDRDGNGIDRAPNMVAVETYANVIKALTNLKPKFEVEVFRFDDRAQPYRHIIRDLAQTIQMLPDSSEPLQAHLNKWEGVLPDRPDLSRCRGCSGGRIPCHACYRKHCTDGGEING